VDFEFRLCSDVALGSLQISLVSFVSLFSLIFCRETHETSPWDAMAVLLLPGTSCRAVMRRPVGTKMYEAPRWDEEVMAS